MWTAVMLLAAAVMAVPLAKRLGLGSVLGYLLAGIAIGPAGFGLVSDVGLVLHVSQIGVTMLLFLIGLELRPGRLWVMRKAVLGLGALQVGASAVALGLLLYWVGMPPIAAAVAGFGLALSSTAMVIPILQERDMMDSRVGRHAFSILLFQDIAIVPALAVLPLLAPVSAEQIGHAPSLGGAAVLVGMLVAGPFIVRPLFRLVSSLNLPEAMTATALLIVVGSAVLAEGAGLSASLGAFAAGVVLSGSEYRHQLQVEIEPFKGLLLGLFFMGVGMAMDTRPLLHDPWPILGLTALIVLTKAAVLVPIARLARHGWGDAARFSVLLAEGGEFAFLLFSAAAMAALGNSRDWSNLSLAVTLSMIAVPPLFAIVQAVCARAGHEKPPRDDDAVDESNPVIICGFGRMGQIVGRVLSSRGIRFTALDSDAGQVDFVRRFGSRVYYGDPTRVDLLRSAGAERAKILVVALPEVEKNLAVVEIARRHFPHLRLIVRARNRLHSFRLMDLGARNFVRETYHSSLAMTEQVLRALGDDDETASETIRTFDAHDREVLATQHAVHTDEKKVIQTQREAADELRSLFESDLGPQAERREAEHRRAATGRPRARRSDRG